MTYRDTERHIQIWPSKYSRRMTSIWEALYEDYYSIKLAFHSSIAIPFTHGDLSLDLIKGILVSLSLAPTTAQGQPQRRSIRPGLFRPAREQTQTTWPGPTLSHHLPLAFSHLYYVNAVRPHINIRTTFNLSEKATRCLHAIHSFLSLIHFLQNNQVA